MRGRAHAQWRRKLPVREPTPSVSVWVSDHMLRQAIERFQRCLVAPCRHLNSHSGPMESRRRMGKRHMTGILPTSSPYRSAWHIEVLADRSTWQWQPPTSSTYRNARKNKLSASGLFNDLINWLEDSDAGKPFIHPPDEAAPAAAAEGAPTLDQPLDHGRSQTPIPSSLHHEVLALRTALSTVGQVDEKTVFELCHTCKLSLWNRILQGELSVPELVFAMNPFEGLDTKTFTSDPTVASRGTAKIHRAILHAFGDAQHTRPSVVSENLWMALAKEVLAIDGKEYTLRDSTRLLDKLMSVMPASFRDKIPSDQIFENIRSYATTQASEVKTSKIPPHWWVTSNRFINVIHMLSQAQLQRVFEAMDVFGEQDGRGVDSKSNIGFTWLLLRAFDSETSRETLTRLYQAYESSGIPFSGVQLWQLLTARLASIGALEKTKFADLLRKDYTCLTERWTTLVFAVIEMPNRERGIQEVLSCLDAMGGSQGVALMPARTPGLRSWFGHIQALVAACSDRTLDHLLVFDIWRSLPSLDERRVSYTWRWKLWFPYLERLIKDPLTEYRVFQLLDITATRDMAVEDAETMGTKNVVKRKTKVLDLMARWYVEAEHLNDRQILRRIQQCIHCQQVLSQSVSYRMLVHAMGAVTVDMEKGMPGRMTRLRWLGKLIEENEGPEKAAAAVSALRSWRWENIQRLKGC